MSQIHVVLPEPDADESGPYAHLGFAEAKPGCEQAVEEAIVGLVDPLRAEEGALQFHVHRDRANPRVFVIYEMFRSKADLERHITQPHTQEFMQTMRPLVTGPLRQQFLRMCSDLPTPSVIAG